MDAVNYPVSQTRLLNVRNQRSLSSFSLSKVKGRTSICYAQVNIKYSDSGRRVTDRLLVLSAPANIVCDVSNSNFAKTLRMPSQWHNLPGRTNCSAKTLTHGGRILSAVPSSAQENVGVLLLNLGGPETLSDVQPFLFNLFADPIIPVSSTTTGAANISFRAPKSKKGYAAIGGGSPLRRMTDDQARALKLALEVKDLDANVYVGMRYWHPFTEDALNQIKKDKITKLVVLPLYPQFSISTSGSSIRVIQNIIREDAYFARLPISIIESWYHREGYIKSMADSIEKKLQRFSKPEEVMIFFSAHGVPLSYVEDAGDPYRDQMEDCISLIMAELKFRGISNEHTLAYQSRVGPVQWLKPYTDEVIVELGQQGVKSLLVVPVSFVSEHIETLEEIDMEYKHLALESGIENWDRVPALCCNPKFISDLADAVIEALPSALVSNRNTPMEAGGDPDPVPYAINSQSSLVFAFLLLLSLRAFSAF